MDPENNGRLASHAQAEVWRSVPNLSNHHAPFAKNHWLKPPLPKTAFSPSNIPISVRPNQDQHATYQWGKWGWDFSAPEGTELVATVEGCIRDVSNTGIKFNASFDELNNVREQAKLGNEEAAELWDIVYYAGANFVVLNWIDGSDKAALGQKNIESLYMHLEKVYPWIKPGVCVKRGTPLGTLGSTGYTSGPHLHYQVQIFKNYINKYTNRQSHWLESIPITFEALFNGGTNTYNPAASTVMASRNDNSADKIIGKNLVETYPPLEDLFVSEDDFNHWPEQDIFDYELERKYREFRLYYEKKMDLAYLVRQSCDTLRYSRSPRTCIKTLATVPKEFEEVLLECARTKEDDKSFPCENGCMPQAIGHNDICRAHSSLDPE